MHGHKQTPLPVSDAGGAGRGLGGGGGGRIRFGYILKVNLTEFADRLDVGAEKKRRIKKKMIHLINRVPVERVGVKR